MGNRSDEEVVTRGDRERASNRLWRLVFWAFLIVMFVIGTVAMDDAEAAGIRCDGALVREGDTVAELRKECGDPDRVYENTNEYGKVISHVFEYDHRYKATRQMLIRNGTIVRIEEL